MKIILSVLVLLVATSFTAGCQDPIVTDTTSYEITLSCPIEKYHPSMSSVPGLPLEVSGFTDLGVDDQILIDIRDGQLLRWHEDGKVEMLNEPYILTSLDTILYWSPLSNDALFKPGAEVDISLTIINAMTEVVYENKQFSIFVLNDGYYVLQEKR